MLNQGPISATDAAARNRGISQLREIADHRSKAYAKDIDAIERFATKKGVSVVRRDLAGRLVKLAGSRENMEAAFRMKLHYYEASLL
jgi:kumamolisin